MTNRALFKAKLQETEWDAVVAFSAENIYFLSGSPTAMSMKDFQQTRPNSPRMVIVLQPRDGEPILMTPERDAGANRETAFTKDVRGYKEYTVTPVQMLAQVLKDTGLGRASIGLEMAALGAVPYLQLLELLPEATFADCGPLFAEARSIKTPEEVATMKEAVDRMDNAFLETFTTTHIGDTEAELNRRMLRNLIDQGLRFGSSTSFTFIGERAAHVRRAFSEEKRLEVGDIVRTDYVASFKNYTANLSRVAVAGEPNAEQRAAYAALLEVERDIAQYMRPGARACDVYRFACDAAARRGYEHAMPLIGHNIGLNVHEDPMLVESDTRELKANMVICLEPVLAPYYHLQDQYLLTGHGTQLLSDRFKTDEIFVIE